MRSPLEDADFNQSPPFADVDLVGIDAPLIDAAKRAQLDTGALSAFGRDWGSAESFDLARQANENPPKLRTVDAKGHRVDRVEFHPAYHALMAKSTNYGIHCSAFDGSGGATVVDGGFVGVDLRQLRAEVVAEPPFAAVDAQMAAGRPAVLAWW